MTWKLIDAIDIIIHIFHPEKRKFYDLESMWSELIPKERLTDMKKNFYKKYILIILTIILLNNNMLIHKIWISLYQKIDLFSEVLEKIQDEYVDEVDQAEVMDAAINGVLQSLDPYSAYMNPRNF